MGEKNQEKKTEKLQPKIISTEEKKIQDQKPPNEKIISFNIYDKNSNEK